MLNKFVQAVRARLITIVIFTVVVVGTVALIMHGNAQRVETTRLLSTTDASKLDSVVLKLSKQDRLQEALVDTEDPNTDANSPQNVKSLAIRTAAADSVNRLLTEHTMPDGDAMRTLYELYKDPDAGVKGKASDGLAILGNKADSLLNEIVERLKDGDPDVRSASVDAIGKIGGDKTAKLVNNMLSDAAARDSAEAALIKVGKPAIPYISLHTNEPDLLYREKIISMFGDIGDASGTPIVIDAANSNQPAIRRVALVALSNIVKAVHDASVAAKTAAAAPHVPGAAPVAPVVGPTNAQIAQAYTGLPVLISALNNKSDDADARAQAAVVIGLAAGNAGIAPLVNALTDYDNHIQQAALAGLISAGQPAVGPLISLSQSKTSPAASVVLAAEALGAIATPSSLSEVRSILGSKSTTSDVQSSAVAGLTLASNPDAAAVLLSALSNADGDVANAAADGLLNPAFEQRSISPLVSLLSGAGNAPFYASQVLAKMGDLAVPQLTAALTSKNPQQQSWAAVTLGETDTKNSTAISILNTLTKSTNKNVQYAATSAVEQLTDG